MGQMLARGYEPLRFGVLTRTKTSQKHLRASTDDAAIVYRRADLEHLELADQGTLDLVGPSAAQIEARPELAIERERPAFLLVSASRV